MIFEPGGIFTISKDKVLSTTLFCGYGNVLTIKRLFDLKEMLGDDYENFCTNISFQLGVASREYLKVGDKVACYSQYSYKHYIFYFCCKMLEGGTDGIGSAIFAYELM